jgi:release factor glutamine methyltransferase
VNFADNYHALIERRADREPVAYISGAQEFWGLSFEVSPAVLIPRPETELIVELLIEYFPERHQTLDVADACTGSGCLAVVIAGEYPAARVVATDLSAEALTVARRNAERHQVSGRIEFRQDDVLSRSGGRFDAIVANPPYISDHDVDTLQPEVRDHEPRIALAGGPDGLDILRTLVRQSAVRLKSSGILLFEFGFGQAQAVTELVAGTPDLALIELREDLQGIARTAVVRRSGRE